MSDKMVYRVRLDNLKACLEDRVDGDSYCFVKVASNSNGLTLSRVRFADLPIVQMARPGILRRKATVVVEVEQDKDDWKYASCTTEDVYLPVDESQLHLGESKTEVLAQMPYHWKPGDKFGG